MTTGTNRPGRKDQRRRQRPDDGGPARLRVLLAAALALAATAFAAMPAQAATGGASAVATGFSSVGEEFVFSRMRVAGATWYGPGLYGNGTACGRTLRPNTMGVAHRSLPCGTPVKFVHRGRAVVTTVIDRGPYVAGIRWDLTNGVRRALGFEGAGPIRYAIARQPGTALESRRRRSGRRAG